MAEKEHEKTSAQVKAALRTVFVVLALSFHSTIEGKTHKTNRCARAQESPFFAGFALALATDSAGVWMNTLATALHKFVISFSVGVELIANKVSKLILIG